MQHNLGWQEGLDIWSSYSAFVMHVSECLKALEIRYELPVRPVRLLDDAHVMTAARDNVALEQ